MAFKPAQVLQDKNKHKQVGKAKCIFLELPHFKVFLKSNLEGSNWGKTQGSVITASAKLITPAGTSLLLNWLSPKNYSKIQPLVPAGDPTSKSLFH